MIIKTIPLLAALGTMALFVSPAMAEDNLTDGTSNTIGFGETSGVPEPSTWATMILGFGGVAALMRRHKPRIVSPARGTPIETR
jgi:hypothetical protein